MINILFLKPHLEAKIWGGTHLKHYNYEFSEHNIGEAWLISAIPNKSSLIRDVTISEKTLLDFYSNNPDFFNYHQGKYPILTKIIDACEDLSIQVHPHDEYALKKHHELGKTECWYILEAQPNASIVYGLKTQDQELFAQAAKNNQTETLLNVVPVKKGDIFFVPSGLVHAIKAGIVIYELQQSSDITYRLFDYNRLENNQPRQLHVEDALNVIDYQPQTNASTKDFLIDCKYFKLKKLELTKADYQLHIPEAMWLEVTVIDGEGTVDQLPFKKGDVFLLRNNYAAKINGHCSLLVGYVTKQQS